MLMFDGVFIVLEVMIMNDKFLYFRFIDQVGGDYDEKSITAYR